MAIHYELTPITDPFYTHSVRVWSDDTQFKTGNVIYMGPYDNYFYRKPLKIKSNWINQSWTVVVVYANNSNPNGYDDIAGIYEENVGTVDWLTGLDILTREDIHVVDITPGHIPPHDVNDKRYNASYWYHFKPIFYRAKTPIWDSSYQTNPLINTGYFDEQVVIVDTPTDTPSIGSGTEQDPWIISSAKDLAYLYFYRTSDKYYALSKDIDASEVNKWIVTYSGLSGWDGLWWQKSDGRFRAHIDGRGYKISNLVSMGSETACFIPILDGGYIKNLGLENIAYLHQIPTRSSSSECAGLVIDMENGALIDNCYVTGKFFGADAGLVRNVKSGSIIKNSFCRADVHIKQAVYIDNATYDSNGNAYGGTSFTPSNPSLVPFCGIAKNVESTISIQNVYFSGFVQAYGSNSYTWWIDALGHKRESFLTDFIFNRYLNGWNELNPKNNSRIGRYLGGSQDPDVLTVWQGSNGQFIFGSFAGNIGTKAVNCYSDLPAMQFVVDSYGINTLRSEIPSGFDTHVWYRKNNINFGLPSLSKFKGYASWETTDFKPWNSVGYDDLRQYIMSTWRYADILDVNGNSLFRVDTHDSSRANWIVDGTDLVLTVIIRGTDEGIILPVTIKGIALYKTPIGGKPLTNEQYIATTLQNAQEQAKITYRIKLPL